MERMTVGELREKIKDVPDDKTILLEVMSHLGVTERGYVNGVEVTDGYSYIELWSEE